jgi:hypothetical protein
MYTHRYYGHLDIIVPLCMPYLSSDAWVLADISSLVYVTCSVKATSAHLSDYGSILYRLRVNWHCIACGLLEVQEEVATQKVNPQVETKKVTRCVSVML